MPVIRSRAVLVAIGINWDGRRSVLGVELANRESPTSWRDVLLGLNSRGLKGVEFVVSDDHPGLKRAIAEVIPEAVWQRCYVHFLRNALDHLPRKATGGRSGWWHMSEPAEAFLDELVTWRELGFNLCAQRQDYDQYLSLPAWAQQTLREHEGDRRRFIYRLEEFERAQTHDPLWNAAQGQLLQEGRIHNYLRMVWGKKILEWTSSPREALDIMIALNNKYGIDGRDPNSYTGILWVLGRYDRPWGPERPIFGLIRYMSSENTRRKMLLRGYLRRFGPEAAA